MSRLSNARTELENYEKNRPADYVSQYQPKIKDVMGQLVGYTMGRSESHMPIFEVLREGPVVMYDDGSGQRVATPARLVALADYLQTLQR